MKPTYTHGRAIPLAAVFAWLSFWAAPAEAQAPATNEIRILILEGEGKAEVSTTGGTDWVSTRIDQLLLPGYRLRIGRNTRATLRWSDQSVVSFKQLTEIEILPPDRPGAQSGLQLIRGIISFFHRDKPGRIRVITRGAPAGVEGTEFVMAVETVNDVEQTRLSVIDGRVVFGTGPTALILSNLQQAIAVVGQPPTLTAGFVANNVLQWCFYYPAVLDLRDLSLTPQEEQAIADSLAAYRKGDLPAALATYPDGRQPTSDAERVYRAALYLSVGEVDQTEEALKALPAGDPSGRLQRLANALRQLIAAVKREPSTSTLSPQLSTELLAASYYEQSLAVRETSLRGALALARQAVTNSPDFGFAWARVAELEFSFGRTSQALEALDKALTLTPRNAQALALRGFLFAAQNKIREAIDWFNQAIAADAALGNAWLGRGLCRIRRGDLNGGREDLLVAAALEPQRATLRSYLGKAYADAGETKLAAHELDLAKRLDPGDPTAWLYSALRLQQHNQINEAVRDLEKSQELHGNRGLYRSGLMLDQDRAVGAANLASIYADAGMRDWSVYEASLAVNYDYVNYSAHLFLANSYDQLRDPNRINLRYETPAEKEYLIANLLAPVGAGTLSQTISQQEYSKLFERDRLGLVSSTEYLSRGAWVENGAQYGTFGNTSYALEAFYRTDPGQRPNNDFDELQLNLKFKQQLTPQDSIFLEAIYYHAEGGDLVQYYDQTSANQGLRTKETQEPTVLLGYNHEWNPGVHTLFLTSFQNDMYSVDNPAQNGLFVNRTSGGLDYVEPFVINLTYQSRLNIYSAEGQQIWETPNHTTIAGLRLQGGEIQTHSLQTNPSVNVLGFVPPTTDLDFTTDFWRSSVYGYHDWRIVDPLLLTIGLSYDWVQFPQNFRAPPISSGEETEDQLSPKAGLIWTPGKHTTVRAAYTRSLAGASIDQSLQLEPTQVSGLLQSFRSIIPESVGGAEAGASFESYGISLEQRFPTGTYLGLSGGILNSEVNRTVGVFDADPLGGFATPSGTREQLDYAEQTLLFTLDQLIGNQLSVGMRYRLSYAELDDDFTGVLPGAVLVDPFQASQHLSATLNQVELHAIYNHPSGFFGQFQALWYGQSSGGYTPDLTGDDFWQFNAFVGYRSPTPRRQVELTLGILNIASQDYRLNPLNLYNDLPRERTFAARLRFSF